MTQNHQGETDLDALLRSMAPELAPDEYVFCSVKGGYDGDVEPVLTFRETEGETLVLSRTGAEKARLDYIYPCRMIVLTIHSALEAVGFLAAITAKLAAAGISVNPVSAYYHDYLFVPPDRAGEAMDILRSLQAGG